MSKEERIGIATEHLSATTWHMHAEYENCKINKNSE